ncbi:TIM barrel protein, partial [Methanoculleus bourgensis]|uniref:TIM barrel protein n=1 Tax=Methanoculleus bourgensis TaxID=83986 RepID=UPI003B940BF1
RDLAAIAASGIPSIIHAPHHGHGVNPCAPAAYDDRPLTEIKKHIELAMNQTLKAADTLGAETIIIHAGWYEPEGRSAALDEFTRFLDRYLDPRFTLENLPAVFRGRPMLGTTAEELVDLADGRIRGFCLDFAHLYCAANYRNIPYPEALKPFQALNIRHFHLSNTEDGSIADRHLPLDHPGGGLPFRDVIQYIRTRPEVPVSLEYRKPAGFYASQVAVFDAIYRR